MKPSKHVHSFGPRGRLQCACGIIPGETPMDTKPVPGCAHDPQHVTWEACCMVERRRSENMRQDTQQKRESILSLLRELSFEERKRVLYLMDDFMCMICGGPADCYCAPCYDE